MNRLADLSWSPAQTPIHSQRQSFESLSVSEQNTLLVEFAREYEEYSRDYGPMDQAMRDPRNLPDILRNTFTHNFLFRKWVYESLDVFLSKYQQFVVQRVQKTTTHIVEDLHNGRINDQRDQKSPVTQLTLGFPDLDPEIFDERARLHGIAFRQIMHTMKHLRQKYQFFPKYDQDGVLQGTYEPFVNRESPDQEARKLLDLLAQEGWEIDTEIQALEKLLQDFDTTKRIEI